MKACVSCTLAGELGAPWRGHVFECEWRGHVYECEWRVAGCAGGARCTLVRGGGGERDASVGEELAAGGRLLWEYVGGELGMRAGRDGTPTRRRQGVEQGVDQGVE
eukprot:350850-Chlamydomonas_euryale.AAC.1